MRIVSEAKSAWAGGNGSAPCRRPTVSTPRTLPGAPSRNTTAGLIWLIAPRADRAARSSVAKSSDVTGSPVASTRPDKERQRRDFVSGHGHIRGRVAYRACVAGTAWAGSSWNQAESAELPGSSHTVAWAAAEAARETR